MKRSNLFSAVLFLAASAILFGCCNTQSSNKNSTCEVEVADKSTQIEVGSKYTQVERQLQEQGLVDIAALDSTIAVYMVYATPHNFMGRKLYNDLNHAFMVPEAATRLIDAAKRLRVLRPDLSLVVYDAARPIAIQHEMWNMVKGTPMSDFVADPTKGRGMHNYGAAIDLTLMDCTGHPLPMGSEYDYFGDESRITAEGELLATGRITVRELENRLLLRKVMIEAGFRTITSEWWHFNLMAVDDAIKTLKMIP